MPARDRLSSLADINDIFSAATPVEHAIADMLERRSPLDVAFEALVWTFPNDPKLPGLPMQMGWDESATERTIGHIVEAYASEVSWPVRSRRLDWYMAASFVYESTWHSVRQWDQKKQDDIPRIWRSPNATPSLRGAGRPSAR